MQSHVEQTQNISLTRHSPFSRSDDYSVISSLGTNFCAQTQHDQYVLTSLSILSHHKYNYTTLNNK